MSNSTLLKVKLDIPTVKHDIHTNQNRQCTMSNLAFRIPNSTFVQTQFDSVTYQMLHPLYENCHSSKPKSTLTQCSNLHSIYYSRQMLIYIFPNPTLAYGQICTAKCKYHHKLCILFCVKTQN